MDYETLQCTVDADGVARVAIAGRVELSTSLGIGLRHEIDPRGGPLHGARRAVTPLEDAVLRGALPGRAHVEEVHEEVIRERVFPFCEAAMLCPARVPPEDTQSPKQHRHFGRGEGQ